MSKKIVIVDGVAGGTSAAARARRLNEISNNLDKQKEVLVYCQVGLRGHVAACLLTNLGYKVKNMPGGFKTW